MTFPSHRDLISGRSRGPVAVLARGGLSIASLFYGAAVRTRNRAFDVGAIHAHRAPVPVVSVGNLTAGGTGKTPVVAAIVEWFTSHGVRPAILSRGYRPHVGAANDEKLVLDQLCPGVPHLQGADRIESAHVACDRHGAQVLVLDDGFQHRRLARDLDLVLIDAIDPWGAGHLLPRGLLREPRASLRRADAVILTRADQCSANDKARLITEIRGFWRDEAPIEARFRPTGLVNADGAHAAIDSLGSVAAFCGIGNPDGFRRTLIAAGVERVAAFRTFPDHHHYSDADLAELAIWVREQRASAAVTTQKDLVKIPRCRLGDVPLWAFTIRGEFPVGQERLFTLLHDLVTRISAPNLSRFQ
ncbi:MAG TPA: tetraacyldisaccharide 4'-kinase [Planctomycetaceae bacterium]|nr:tetraacyldisaccharide 4'-kinase [Planctomycetaceae bacterium]